jgi:hypothetical protein
VQTGEPFPLSRGSPGSRDAAEGSIAQPGRRIRSVAIARGCARCAPNFFKSNGSIECPLLVGPMFFFGGFIVM